MEDKFYGRVSAYLGEAERGVWTVYASSLCTHPESVLQHTNLIMDNALSICIILSPRMYDEYTHLPLARRLLEATRS